MSTTVSGIDTAQKEAQDVAETFKVGGNICSASQATGDVCKCGTKKCVQPSTPAACPATANTCPT